MTTWTLVSPADGTPDWMAVYSEGADATGLPIPAPPADVARELKAERVRRSLRKRLDATPPAPALPADPDERETELCRRNPRM